MKFYILLLKLNKTHTEAHIHTKIYKNEQTFLKNSNRFNIYMFSRKGIRVQ